MLYYRRAAAGSPLPPGFRFRPTDEELLTHYLAPKAADAGFSSAAVREVDLYKAEPWDLMPPHEAEAMAGGGGGEDGCRYFFCRRSVKFPSGRRTNRATRAGYWKSTGKDKVVLRQHGGGEGSGCPLGVKKTLVFYRGRAPRGDKTNWVMHEYRLVQGHASPAFARTQSEWVIYRVFMKKPPGDNKNESVQHDQGVLHSPLDDHLQAAIDGSYGKTPAGATSDSAHANFFSNAPTVAPGDQETEAVLQLNHDQELLMNYSVSDLHASAMASPAAAMLLRNEMAEAADSFDLLPQLLDYEGFPQDFF